MTFRWSPTVKPTGGDLTSDNLNSLDAGLNVYASPAGGLNIRVSPGSYIADVDGVATRVDHAGQTSDLLLAGSATRYVFVNAAGVITAAAAWPAALHLPLAEVVTGVSTITSITDRRARLGGFVGGSSTPGGGFTVGSYYGQGRKPGSTTASLTADTLYAVRFDVPQNSAADRLAVEVTTLHASNIRLGIYGEGTAPDSPEGAELLQDGGTVSVGTTGVKTVTIDVDLPPGRYWLAIIAASGTAAFRALPSTAWAPHELGAADFSTAGTMWKAADGANNEASALPDPFPGTLSLLTTPAPVLAIRAAAP